MCQKLYWNYNGKNLWATVPLKCNSLGTHLKGSKKFRRVLTKDQVDLNENLYKKWTQKLNIPTEELQWSKIFKICSNTIADNNLVWFQYRIIHRILGTLSFRKKMNKSDSNSCRLCQKAEETLEHLFVSCPHSEKLWRELKNQTEELSLKPENILMGN